MPTDLFQSTKGYLDRKKPNRQISDEKWIEINNRKTPAPVNRPERGYQSVQAP